MAVHLVSFEAQLLAQTMDDRRLFIHCERQNLPVSLYSPALDCQTVWTPWAEKWSTHTQPHLLLMTSTLQVDRPTRPSSQRLARTTKLPWLRQPEAPFMRSYGVNELCGICFCSPEKVLSGLVFGNRRSYPYHCKETSSLDMSLAFLRITRIMPWDDKITSCSRLTSAEAWPTLEIHGRSGFVSMKNASVENVKLICR